MPLKALADHVPTQPAYNQSIALDTSTGDLTIGIYTSDGFEDSPPEKYTIWFTISDETIDISTAYCISTSFGHTDNLVWNYHVFSLEDLQTYFENPYGTFRTKIRSDNDTDQSYSTLTLEQSIVIPNELPFINLGEWTAPTNTCNDTSTTTTTTTSSTTTTIVPEETTTTTTVPEETTTTTSSTTTTTTTTTLPPKPEPQPEPPPAPAPEPEPEPEPIEIVMDDGTVAEYTETEVEDGTVQRDNERQKNFDLYGVELTDEQVERGDLELYDIEIIEEEDMGELGEEFFEDVDIPEFVEDEPIEEEYIELTEEEVEELEREMERDVKKLEYEEEIEIFVFEDEKEIEEFIDTIIQVEEYLDDFEEVEIVIIEDIENLDIDIEDIQIDIQEDKEQDEQDETDIPSTDVEEPKIPPLEDITEEIEEILTEEVVEEEVAELEQVIEEIIEVPDIQEEDMSDEEIEEAIEVFVQELATEEVVEVLEEVNDIGVQNLSQATEETQVVIQQVVEKAVENVEDLSDDQVEVVAEVLQVQTEDVEIIAEAVKEDEVVAEAVEEYVERAVENADVENYTLADVVTEVQFETFLENPIETFVDIDVTEINITTIGNDMTQDQKEKAQEVVVPVILTRIATMAAFVFRKTL
jgi:hypothetical protein